jgi:hypothetical protein
MLFEITLAYLAIINLGILGYEYNMLLNVSLNSIQLSLTLNKVFCAGLFLWLGIYYPFAGYVGVVVRLYKLILK